MQGQGPALGKAVTVAEIVKRRAENVTSRASIMHAPSHTEQTDGRKARISVRITARDDDTLRKAIKASDKPEEKRAAVAAETVPNFL